MYPSSNLATLRPDLAGSFMEWDFAMNQAGLIGSQVAPIIDVAEAFGNFGRIPVEQLMQRRQTRRQVTGDYNRSQWKFEPDSFTTEEHGLEEPVDDKEVKMYRNYADVEQITADRVFDGLLMAYEQRVADLLFNTSVFTGALTHAVAHSWKSHSTSLPIDDMTTYSEAFRDNCGFWPNAAIMTRKTFRHARQSEQIIDRIKFWGGDDPKTRAVSRAVLADLFDLEQVIIANSVQNTANEGQDATLESIWDDDFILLCLINKSPDIRKPTVARTFQWAEDGGDINGVVEMYRDEKKRADIIRCRHQTGEKIMHEKYGFLLTGAAQ